tara:strand:+ start:2426 stop:2617 length:192 start_codon:yes stop_codon:yes gene_type:complete
MDSEDKEFLKKLKSPIFLIINILSLIIIISAILYFVKDDDLYMYIFFISGGICLVLENIRKKK